MMKHEFENLLGTEVGNNEYEKIEKVYMNIEGFTKATMVDIYKIGIIDSLCDYIAKCESEKTELLNSYSELQTRFFDNTKMFSVGVSRLQSENEVLQNDNENLISDLQDYETENAKLIAENEVLQNKVTDLKNHNLDRVEKLETENDELKTQLHQYQALFADIERNMTVSLWKSLLGTANN